MKKNYIFVLLICMLSVVIKAQTVVTIGTGTSVSIAGTSGDPIYRSTATSTVHHSKSANLLTAAQISTAGILSGSTITEFGYYKGNAGVPSGANAWAINVYLKNSSATSLASGTAWSTMISGATLVYTATITSANMPAVAGYWDWVLTAPFTYTGNAIESYVEWVPINVIVSPFTTSGFTWQYSTTSSDQALGTSSNVSIPPSNTLFTTQSRHYNVRIKYLQTLFCAGTPAPGNTLSTANTVCAAPTLLYLCKMQPLAPELLINGNHRPTVLLGQI